MEPSATSCSEPLLPESPRVAILGDSLVAGYGVRGRSYAQLVAERLGASEIVNLARSTYTVLNAVQRLTRLHTFAPDLVIVSVGGSEALVHAGARVQHLVERYAPKSWRGVEGLEPKPRFARKRSTRYREIFTTTIKLVIKHVGVRITGGYRRMEPGPFAEAFETLMKGLHGLDCVVLVVGFYPTDDRLWPRTNASSIAYESAIRRSIQNYDHVIFFDPKQVALTWSDFMADRIHFNELGHAKVADEVIEVLKRSCAQRGGVSSDD